MRGFFKKMQLSRAAAKDVKRGFEDALFNWRDDHKKWLDKGGNQDLVKEPTVPISSTMELMVDQYHNSCEQIINDTSNNVIKNIFQGIQESNKILISIKNNKNEDINNINSHVKNINDNIEEVDKAINHLNDRINESRKKGQVDPTAGVRAMPELNNQLDALKKERTKLINMLSESFNTISNIKDRDSVNVEAQKNNLRNFSIDFNNQLKILQGNLNLLTKEYGHWYSHYWMKVCHKTKMVITQLSFVDICELRRKPIVKINDVLIMEREYTENAVKKHITDEKD